MIINLIDPEELLNAHVYYPSFNDIDWVELKTNIVHQYKIVTDCQIAVKDVAQYLLSKGHISNKLTEDIFVIYKSFDYDRLGIIETCPSIDSSERSTLFLRGGNKRSIAYAMKLLNGEISYAPIQSSHLTYFTRKDDRNLSGLPTTHGE